ncbi:hypothetical protein A9Q99_23650 [Gammaproteobacteria bacterium 45_16_T64]|nr:hypothetical protein A9Q99_23650 [Gammaproteobacteria bacterium 45_16_T64]
MNVIERKTPFFVIRFITTAFQRIGKSSIEAAIQGDFRPLRKLLDTYGGVGIPGVKIEDDSIGNLKSQWFIPKSVKDDTIVMYCHGGGFCAGSTSSHKHMASLFAKNIKRKLLVFDYRLAPEHAYPAQIDDGLRVYLELLKSHPPHNIVFAGDSSGGGMVLALSQRIRDEKLSLPKAIVAICPWFDYEVKLAQQSDIEDPGLPIELIQSFSKNVFQNNTQRKYSPKYTSFENLPPINLLIGGADTLYAENTELGNILIKENEGCQIERWEDMPHVWQSLHPFLLEANKSAKYIAEFIDRQT